MRTCQYHKDRPGIGICMSCHAVICAACCTRVNGVNHCHACLKGLAERQEEKHGGKLRLLLTAFLLGVAWLVLFGLCWAISGRMAP